MKESFLFLLILLSFSCHNNKRTDTFKPAADTALTTIHQDGTNDSAYREMADQIRNDPYSATYDTALKEGFTIVFSFDREEQYLVVKKGKKIVDTIGGGSLGMLYKSIGYVGADFDESMVFVSSSGSGNPHYIWLYEKNGDSIVLKDTGAWIDVDTTQQVVLYSSHDVPAENDSMMLYDSRRHTSKSYPYPKEVFGEPRVNGRIRLLKMNHKSFVIEFEKEKISKQQLYIR